MAVLILFASKRRYPCMTRRSKMKTESIPELEGYATELRAISMLWANIAALVVMVALGVAGLAVMYFIWGGIALGRPWSGTLFLVLLVAGIAVHELMHGLTWMWVTHSGFGHLRFGVLKGGVYCHIDVPMVKKKYVVGTLMPLLILGVAPFLLSFIVQSLWMMLFGVIFIACAMGDVMIVWAIRKEPSDTLVYDHPSEAGCLVYHKV